MISSLIPFTSCFQSFPVSGSFTISQFFTSGGQSIILSASASVRPMNIQDWFPSGWAGFISGHPCRMTIYNLHVPLSLFGTSLFHFQFCCFLNCIQISQEEGRWSGIPITLRIFQPHSQQLWCVNKAEVDSFLELSCFFCDPMDVGNLISDSSAFFKSN